MPAQVTIPESVAGGAYPGLLGVLPPELFDAFQQLRWPLLRWLQAHSAECDTVMEALVRAITFCEDADEHNSSPNAQRSFGTVAKRRAVARQWTSLT